MIFILTYMHFGSEVKEIVRRRWLHSVIVFNLDLRFQGKKQISTHGVLVII